MERVCHGRDWYNNKKTVKLAKEFGGHPGMNMRLVRSHNRPFH
jgi:hypothetical protein